MLYLNGFEFWRHFNWDTVYMICGGVWLIDACDGDGPGGDGGGSAVV